MDARKGKHEGKQSTKEKENTSEMMVNRPP